MSEGEAEGFKMAMWAKLANMAHVRHTIMLTKMLV